MITTLRPLPDTITIHKGCHEPGDPSKGDPACLLELVSWVAGEPWSDHPECVSPILGAFGRQLNDRLPDTKRQQLRPLIPRLVGTAGDGHDEARGYLALDWLIRTCTPAWLDLAGLSVEADELRGLRRIVDLAAAQSAGPVVRQARDRAAAGWNAAWNTARDAPWDWDAARGAAWKASWVATWGDSWAYAEDVPMPVAMAAAWYTARNAALIAAQGAAWDDAREAARGAAWDAAREAARGAAWDAALIAARKTLAPTDRQLHDSAIALLKAMINPPEVAT